MSVAIAENVLSRELTDSCGAELVLEPVPDVVLLPLGELLLLLLHAAISRAALTAAAVRPALLVTEYN
ncbi:MAG: hypothetical protein JOY82_04870 [Streptosporangiaceae bacterium]|nr:hypothetical protein [Streptosporangiaceae bacterium]